MIASVFEMSNVTREERHILQNLILVPPFGISTETFFDYCKLDSYETIDELIFKHLILHDSARDVISLHPVICRTVAKELGLTQSSVSRRLLPAFRRKLEKGMRTSCGKFPFRQC